MATVCFGGGILQTCADEYDMSAEEADAFIGQLIRCRAEGVFFVPFEHRADSCQINARMTTRLRRAGIAVILIDRDITPFPKRSSFDLVGVDNFAGGYELAEHLLKSGAKRLGFVTIPHTASTADARIAGARAAIAEQGRSFETLSVFKGDPADASFVRSIVRVHKIDGVLCTSDHVAALFMKSALREGIRVPRDVQLVGFDDTPVAEMLSVPLTTMAQPCRDIAAIAFHTLCERIKFPSLPARVQRLSPKLIVRESSMPLLKRRP